MTLTKNTKINLTKICLQIFVVFFASSNIYASSFYQINSETISLPKTPGVQADLKLLAGYETTESFAPNIIKRSKAAIGAYTLYQSANDPSYFLRYGPVLHLRTELFIDNLFLQYEHHQYQVKSSTADITTSKAENRYGLIYSRYDVIHESVYLDSYIESFYIPEISTRDLLSVARATLQKKNESDKIFPILELYVKSSPTNFGGNLSDLRLGIQANLVSSVSLKLMANVLPKTDTNSTGLLLQLNIFSEGSL